MKLRIALGLLLFGGVVHGQVVHHWAGRLLGHSVTCQSASVFAGCTGTYCVDGVGLWCRHTPRHSVSLTMRSIDARGDVSVEGFACRSGPKRLFTVKPPRGAHGPCCKITGTATSDYQPVGSPVGGLLALVGDTTHVEGDTRCGRRMRPISLGRTD